MPNKYSNITCLVYDSGLGMDHAARLARDCKTVWYFTPWIERMKYASYALGENLVPNMVNVVDFEDYLDRADLICFFDLGGGGRAKNLRKQAKLVFGGGDGEKFEEYRYNFRQLQQKIGLPTQKTELIKGITNLRNYAQKNKNFFVKHNIFRGDFESLLVKDFDSAEMSFDEIETELGPKKESYEFMIEPKLEGLMCGIDTFSNGNQFLWPIMYGWEDESGSYIGKVCNKKEEMPKQLIDLMDKIIKLLQRVVYRGAISIEVMLTDKDKYYPIDMTMRMAYPLSLIYTEYISNYSDLIWGVAKGENVVPQYKNKYLGCLATDTKHSKDNWTRLIFPENLRTNIKLQSAAKYDKYYYFVKGFSGSAVFINGGNSVAEVFNPIRTLATKFDCKSYDDNIESLDRIEKTISKSKEFGITF